MNRDDKALFPPIKPMAAGSKAVCPRCGQGRMFAGLLTPVSHCTACGLDYSFIDAGDGPAVFVIMLLGFLVVALAMIVESVFDPPMWLHALLWVPFITITGIWMLRVMKGVMIALQYRTHAGEGQRMDENDQD